MRTRQSRIALESSVAGRRPMLETLEQRRLQTATVASWTTDSISNPSATYAAMVSLGDNNPWYGQAGMAVMENGVTTDSDLVAWDMDLSDGLDSGWRAVEYSVSLGSSGSNTLDVDGTTDAGSSASTGTNMTQVTVLADVRHMNMGMAWQDVVVSFYHGDTLIDSVSLGGISVDTTGAPTDAPAESGKTASIDAANCDRIVITGTVRLTAAAETMLFADDIFGQVLIS